MLSIYQNSNTDHYEHIKACFIVRTIEYETIISSLEKRKKGDSIQHELILGRRGSGKSTLLKRIEVEIRENKKLQFKYVPVNLAEEQAGIYRLMDLWEQVLSELYCQIDKKHETQSFSNFDNEQAYTRYLYGEIHRFCETNKKKAVLLLDNFDRIVCNFSDDGNLLRETLINYHDLVLIAASTRMDEHFWQYDLQFYEFFRRFRLETVSSDEAFLLLDHWSNSLDFNDQEKEKMKNFLKKHRGKVENIRLLTDGLPRTMLFFLKLVMQTDKPEQTDFLKKIMDEVTPLYQERLQNITPPMRKIILEMAFIWEATPTKEIAEKCKMDSKLVAANLNTLADRKIVEIISTDKRNNLYRISERFFNMWLIVTQGNPEQKRKARWMSEFLENLYDKQELQSLAEQYMDNLAIMYYEQNRNKEQAKQYISNVSGADAVKILIEIWAGVFNDVEERAISLCSRNEDNSIFIEQLLVLQQKSLVDKLFHYAEFGKRLREQYAVLYYVSQILNGKDKEDNLRLRIPPELESTVESVLKRIEIQKKRYLKSY